VPAHGGSAPNTTGNNAREAEEALRCFQLRLRGLSYRTIAAETGMSAATVYRRVEEHLSATVTPAADAVRAMELERLDDLAARTYAVLVGEHPLVQNGRVIYQDDVPVRDPRPVLGAVDRLIRIQERRARLLGLDMPARMDATVHKVGPEDIELTQLINEAKAKVEKDEAMLRLGIEGGGGGEEGEEGEAE
jgi:hypothetical protein